MGLTKEECEYAVEELDYLLCELEELRTQVSVNCIFDEGLEKIKQLINEHFDNPPLAVDKDHLIDWYINSVDNHPPVWTEKHIDELLHDFDVSLKHEKR